MKRTTLLLVAGLEDVVAVYGAMLEDDAAENIGIYGCSAGAMLTAQAVGVEADLHVWEGLGHATFAFNPRLPESDKGTT